MPFNSTLHTLGLENMPSKIKGCQFSCGLFEMTDEKNILKQFKDNRLLQLMEDAY